MINKNIIPNDATFAVIYIIRVVGVVIREGFLEEVAPKLCLKDKQE